MAGEGPRPAAPTADGSDSDLPAQHDRPQLDLEMFWRDSSANAKSEIASLRRRLPYFSSPPLRVQRVGQLDGDLLDKELLEILLAPLKEAINSIQPTLASRVLPEMLLIMRLALFKFSIVDHQASYGSMLQNLRYRNEWAHKGGLQSTAKDRRLASWQLGLYPIVSAVLPYVYTRTEMVMARRSYSELSAHDVRSSLWTVMDRSRRWIALAAFVNFALFLSNGKYRTLADRMLGMRLVYAQRTVQRNVSFEYLNRQLVWHAFTEFLVFLLPLVKPRRLLRRLSRLPVYTWILRVLSSSIPTPIKTRLGITSGGNSKALTKPIEKAPPAAHLPETTCALCWQRAQATQAASSGILRAGLPSSDPLDPSSGALAIRSDSLDSAPKAPPRPDDLNVTIPYAAQPCGHVYCYHCLASILLAEETAEDLEDDRGWPCLRCSTPVRSIQRGQLEQHSL